MSWQRLTAKYAGACAVCRGPIPAGTDCLWDRDRKVVAHPACVDEQRRATPAPEPRTRLPLWAHQRAAYEHLYPLVLDPVANIEHHCREMLGFWQRGVRGRRLCECVFLPARPRDWGGGRFRRTEARHRAVIEGA